MTAGGIPPIRIGEARVVHYRAPLDTPYRTTFGAMTHRQAVVITLTTDDGVVGIAESWVNFPLWAPSERIAAFMQGYFPQIVGREITGIPRFIRGLWDSQYRAALQSATLGPALQALCAVEAALLDIEAKRRGVPLGRLFAESPARTVKAYASGINPPFPVDSISQALDAGIDTFKLKLGYGADSDRENISALKRLLGPGVRVAVDVNRSWSFDRTLAWMDYLRDEGIAWLEEPLAIEYQHRYPELRGRAAVPVSAGENFLIQPGADFSQEGEGGLSLDSTGLALDIVQPSVVKNCCFSDAVRLMELVERGCGILCPHFLGSAPGMVATAHLASISRNPYLEWDINPNPLRTSLFREPFRIADGFFKVSDEPGIGWMTRSDIPDAWIGYAGTVSAEK